jgi:hypothetical protein
MSNGTEPIMSITAKSVKVTVSISSIPGSMNEYS